MAYSKNQLDEMQKVLYSAVIADILDDIGVKNFNLPNSIYPILDSGSIMGYARTVYACDVFEVPKELYKLELEFIDSVKENDVIMAVVSGQNHNGFFGELLATAAMARGSRGAIIDGYIRDVTKISEMKYPIYAKGMNPLDSKGRVDVMFYDEPIICGSTQINNGDLIFADIDGIVVTPAKYEQEVIEKAMVKVNGENKVREELKQGKSAKEIFEKYGIL